VTTNLPFLRWLVTHPVVRAGEATTAFLTEHPPLSEPPLRLPDSPWRGGWRLNLPLLPPAPAPDVDGAAHERAAGPGSGDIIRDGKPLRIRKPGDALRHGIVLIPEDRGVEGLHLGLPIRWNLAMATLGDRSRVGIIRMAAEAQFARSAVERMGIKSSSPYQEVSALSGGTQQKVVIGKFIATRPKVLLFVDSTRGIDVHTKFEFYEMLRDLARSGAVCVVYSSDTEELVGLCDRVAVFHDGAPALMLEGNEVTQDAVVAASFAVAKGTA